MSSSKTNDLTYEIKTVQLMHHDGFSIGPSFHRCEVDLDHIPGECAAQFTAKRGSALKTTAARFAWDHALRSGLKYSSAQ